MDEEANKPQPKLRLEFYDQATGDLINRKPWPNIPLPNPGDRLVLTVEPPLVWCVVSRLYFFHPDNLLVVEYFVKQLTLAAVPAAPEQSDNAETQQTPSERFCSCHPEPGK